MKKKFVYITILLLIIILQTSMLPVIVSNEVVPNMLLMAILAWSVLDGFSAFLGWAIFAGILYDLAAYSPIGVSVLIFVLAVYFVSFFSRRLTVELKGMGILFFVMFVIVATIISRFILALSISWELKTLHDYWKIFGSFGSISVAIICNEILFFVLFIVIRKIKKFFEIEN